MIKIIAEPDISWEGDAFKLADSIHAAGKAGADMYKLQLYNTRRLGCDWADKHDFYKERETTDRHIELARKLCYRKNMNLLVTLNDTAQAKRAFDLGVRYAKIASGQLGEVELLKEVAEWDWTTVFLSTGMSTSEEIEQAVRIMEKGGQDICLMHCVSLYPVPREKANLDRVNTLATLYPQAYVGYSDHTSDWDVVTGSLWLSMDYLEVHFHIKGHTSPVPDDMCTDEYDLVDLCRMRDSIHKIMNTGKLEMQEGEEETYEKYKGRWIV